MTKKTCKILSLVLALVLLTAAMPGVTAKAYTCLHSHPYIIGTHSYTYKYNIELHEIRTYRVYKCPDCGYEFESKDYVATYEKHVFSKELYCEGGHHIPGTKSHVYEVWRECECSQQRLFDDLEPCSGPPCFDRI